MSRIPAPAPLAALSLTQEEAIALLEMCALTLAPESSAHVTVLSRLNCLYREAFTRPLANPGSPIEDRVEHRNRLRDRMRSAAIAYSRT